LKREAVKVLTIVEGIGKMGETVHVSWVEQEMAADIEQFTPMSIQSAVFVRRLDFSDPLSVAQGVRHAVGGVFNGQPGVFPVPPNAPPNVPRIVLADRANRYQCKLSAERVDLSFNGGKGKPEPMGVLWDTYCGILRQLAEYFKKKKPTTVWRLGLVMHLFRVLPGSAGKHIQETYLKGDRFLDAYEVQLNVLNREQMEAFNINRWLRLRPMRKKDDPKDDRGLVVEIDINTPAEESNDFSEEEITGFFEEAYRHIAVKDMLLVDIE
jgi:hypothetical protein